MNPDKPFASYASLSMEYFGKNLSDLRKKEPLSCKHANTTMPIDFSIKSIYQ